LQTQVAQRADSVKPSGGIVCLGGIAASVSLSIAAAVGEVERVVVDGEIIYARFRRASPGGTGGSGVFSPRSDSLLSLAV
jgi:hypothetical protein